MRTLIATVLENGKGNGIYCAARKVSDKQIDIIRSVDRDTLKEMGFTFIRMISLEYDNVKGYAIFFEGHVDEMTRSLREISKKENT